MANQLTMEQAASIARQHMWLVGKKEAIDAEFSYVKEEKVEEKKEETVK